ncbi:phosphotransferase enzyme family protein [Pseudoalteromonas sp. SSDWG2]|uniref:phosphotransferase enzyme family protein n=1 Tax=Pseudoalteromonas sp. SSDWG2 TaxID=3139391 RepID=UPI003BACF446
MNTERYAKIIAQQFGFDHHTAKMKPIGNGHINTTMLLQHSGGAVVVQKLNTQVFAQPQELIANARKIEQHLKGKQVTGEYNLEIIEHLPTLEQRYSVEIEGQCWRALAFISESRSEDVVLCAAQAKIAAGAFGQFAAALQDFDATLLYPVIKNFHNLSMRMQMLDKAVREDKAGRVASVAEQLAFCNEQMHLVDELAALEQVLPLRVCHNDTKINNMLFSTKDNSAKAVIDLDTCMPGLWLFDFGDMVRTFCSPETEDSTNLDNVVVREDIFAALVQGYIEPLKEHITAQEKASFWLGAQVMPFMIGVRFLTDYLDGDNYFSIKHPNHNLERANNQFALYRDVVAQQHTLKALILQA